jgi:hypothetical protein
MPSIRNFVDSFSQSEVARTNRFDVYITFPESLTKYKNQLPSNMAFRCENANLPGRTFGTVDQKFGSNPTQKHPIHTSYEDLTLGFLVSGNMKERTIFDIWMEFINPTYTFDFNYKDEYTATINVRQYDLQNNLTYSVNLFKSYPVSINQMDLDWSTDTPHKLSVVFAYDYWQISGIQQLLNDSDYQNIINQTTSTTPTYITSALLQKQISL